MSNELEKRFKLLCEALIANGIIEEKEICIHEWEQSKEHEGYSICSRCGADIPTRSLAV